MSRPSLVVALLATLVLSATGCLSTARDAPVRTPAAPTAPAPTSSPRTLAARSAQGDQRATAIVEYAALILRNLSQTINATDGDCPVLAHALDEWLTVNGERLDGQLLRAASIPTAERARLMQAAIGRDRDVLRAMTVLGSCASHAGVASAVRRLQLI